MQEKLAVGVTGDWAELAADLENTPKTGLGPPYTRSTHRSDLGGGEAPHRIQVTNENVSARDLQPAAPFERVEGRIHTLASATNPGPNLALGFDQLKVASTRPVNLLNQELGDPPGDV
jgi:hypothetical protein